VAPNVHDRNRGQGLPSTVSDESYWRIAHAMERRAARSKYVAAVHGDPEPVTVPAEARRFASLNTIAEAGFRRIAVGTYIESGFSRKAQAGMDHLAHPIWELRQADDGQGGYLLIRKKEEREVDLRTAQHAGVGTAAAVASGIVRTAQKRQPASFQPGDVVKYKASFLQSVGWHTGVPKNGKVVGVAEGLGFPIVDFADGGEPRPVNPANLQMAGKPDYSERGGAYASRKNAAGPKFMVSLLQTPGGSIADRKTVISADLCDLDEIQRLVREIKMGPAELNYDTWTDGEWELRIRGPRGEYIHEHEATEPGEIGGERGAGLLEMIEGAVNAPPEGEDIGPVEPMEEAPVPLDLGGEPGAMPPAEGVPPEPLPMPTARLKVGQRVLAVRNGQVADAVVMMIRPHEQAIDLMFGGSDGVLEEQVPMEMLLGEPEVEIELESGGEEPEEHMDDGPPEDGVTVVDAADLGEAGPGGAGQDPFDVAVEPASKEEPVTFGGTEPDRDEIRQAAHESMMRRAQAILDSIITKKAVEFTAFSPGTKLVVRDAFPAFYAGQKQIFQPGDVVVADGFHTPDQDAWHAMPYLGKPAPRGTPFENLRLRVQGPNGPAVISLQELDQHFDLAVGQQPAEEEVGELPGVYETPSQQETTKLQRTPSPQSGPPPLPSKRKGPPPLPSKRTTPPPLPGQEPTYIQQTTLSKPNRPARASVAYELGRERVTVHVATYVDDEDVRRIARFYGTDVGGSEPAMVGERYLGEARYVLTVEGHAQAVP
jgi:hypothetical protein